MNHEQTLVALFADVFTEALQIAMKNVALGTEEKPKRTRTTKKDVPAPTVITETKFDDNATVASSPADQLAQAEVPVFVPAPIINSTVTGLDKPVEEEGLSADQVQRKHVSAALITVAKRGDLGPAKAFTVLNRYNAKEVKDLKESDYRNVVLDCAKMLDIAPTAMLTLDPTK